MEHTASVAAFVRALTSDDTKGQMLSLVSVVGALRKGAAIARAVVASHQALL